MACISCLASVSCNKRHDISTGSASTANTSRTATPTARAQACAVQAGAPHQADRNASGRFLRVGGLGRGVGDRSHRPQRHGPRSAPLPSAPLLLHVHKPPLACAQAATAWASVRPPPLACAQTTSCMCTGPLLRVHRPPLACAHGRRQATLCHDRLEWALPAMPVWSLPAGAVTVCHGPLCVFLRALLEPQQQVLQRSCGEQARWRVVQEGQRATAASAAPQAARATAGTPRRCHGLGSPFVQAVQI